MTVVVGFVGPGGAVMASDSEATESEHTRFDVEKIWSCGGLLMGYTGTNSVKQPLVHALGPIIENEFGPSLEVDRQRARDLLRQTSSQVFQNVYQFHVGTRDGNGIPHALQGALIVIGRDSSGYWILEIDSMAQGTFYTDPGFHSVGSGAAAAYFARSLMRDYDTAERQVADLKLIAHRTVKTCIDTIGGTLGVGGQVQIWTSQDKGPFTKATAREIEVIENGVIAWRTAERESLEQVLRGGKPESAGAPMPTGPPSP